MFSGVRKVSQHCSLIKWVSYSIAFTQRNVFGKLTSKLSSYRCSPETKKPLELRATCHMLRWCWTSPISVLGKKLMKGRKSSIWRSFQHSHLKKICLNPLLPIIPIWARYIFPLPSGSFPLQAGKGKALEFARRELKFGVALRSLDTFSRKNSKVHRI